MTTYVGIDLGTTNSAIATFDGENVRLYKNPDQHDVTPSAIFIDRRGNKYIGKRAYDNAARSPENCATLFKRLMGTSTPINLPELGWLCHLKNARQRFSGCFTASCPRTSATTQRQAP